MKRQNRKLVIVAAFLLSASACAAPPTPTPDPLDLVTTFQDTWNQQDSEGVLALFADSATWNWGYTLSGAKGIGNFIEYSTQLNGQWKLSDCQLADGEVTCMALYTDDCFPPELLGLQSEITFEFTNGKIAQVAGPINHIDSSVLEKRHVLVQNWASTNLSDDYAKFVDPDEWRMFTGTGDQSSGKLTAVELGQAMERMCKGYAEAKP